MNEPNMSKDSQSREDEFFMEELSSDEVLEYILPMEPNPINDDTVILPDPLFQEELLPLEDLAADEDIYADEEGIENGEIPDDGYIALSEPDFEYEDEFDDDEEFEEMFTMKNAKKQSRKQEHPTRKGRPKKKKGAGLWGIPQLLASIIWLLVILAIGVSLGRVLWVCAADVLAFGREPKDVTVSITASDTMESITNKLYNAGLIRYPELFSFYADLTDAEDKLITGTFTLSTVYDYHALVNAMSTRGNRAIVEDVVIPEGFTCRQIFARLEDKGICSAAALEEWAANGELKDYWFLENVQRGDKYCLEGYLFPDTYDFYENSTPKEVLQKLLDTFEYRFSEELRSQVDALNANLTEKMRANGSTEEFIAENQFTVADVITVASLIEKETSSNDESPRIASVIYNRLFSWGTNPRFLNIDASVIYALDGKTDLTAEDMTYDHPYNTYVNTGLTPGPIANPGLASIKAALNPEATGYYYYVLNPESGVHQFSKTYEEHQEWVAKFRGES